MRGLIARIYEQLIILGWVKSRKKTFYVSRVRNKAKWVYVSYIPEVLCDVLSEKEMRSHQNLREQIAMVKCLNELGYNVFVQNYSTKPIFPNINVAIIFGLEPVFEEACMHYPEAKKIYYATGAYYEFQNRQVRMMTDYVNKKCQSRLPYYRIVRPHNSAEIADAILQIGSLYTVQTYPQNLQKKITCIHQSTQEFKEYTIQYAEENEYLFVASAGNVLKGAFLLLEYFSCHPELTLHWVGPMEDDFKHAVSSYMKENIKTYGFLDWNSETMHNIVNRCNYIIYPSGTEGTPGAVLCAMKCGLIPIVSKPAAFDEIETYGIIINDYKAESIGKSIATLSTLKREEILERKRKCSEFIQENYTLDQYSKELMMYFMKLS